MANGHRPPSPIGQALKPIKINPHVARSLMRSGGLGLLDTLQAIAGRQFSVDTLADKMKEPGLLGVWAPGTDVLQVNVGRRDAPIRGGMLQDFLTIDRIPPDVARETVIHEAGHFTSEATKRLPQAREAAQRGLTEPVARAFLRAYAALGATRGDTTNSEGVMEQFAMGIHPSLSERERRLGYIPGTRKLIGELLALPIFRNHPLRTRQQQILNEAESIR